MRTWLRHKNKWAFHFPFNFYCKHLLSVRQRALESRPSRAIPVIINNKSVISHLMKANAQICESVSYLLTAGKDPPKWLWATCTKLAQSHNSPPSRLLFCSGGAGGCFKQSTRIYCITCWHTSSLQPSTHAYCNKMRVLHGIDGEYKLHISNLEKLKESW